MDQTHFNSAQKCEKFSAKFVVSDNNSATEMFNIIKVGRFMIFNKCVGQFDLLDNLNILQGVSDCLWNLVAGHEETNMGVFGSSFICLGPLKHDILLFGWNYQNNSESRGQSLVWPQMEQFSRIERFSKSLPNYTYDLNDQIFGRLTVLN